MKEIKTRESKKDIRVLDKSAELTAKMKRGISRTKEQTRNLTDTGQATPEEYAQDNVKYASEDVARNVVRGSKNAVQKGYDGSKRLVQQIKQKRRDADSIKQTAKSTGKQTFKTVKRDIKTAGQSARKTVKTAEQTSRSAIKTTERVAKNAEKAVKAAEKAAKASAKAAKKSAQAAKKTAEAAAKAAKTVVKATIAAVKAAAAGIKSLVAAIAAGGWVAVVIILVITMVALIVGSGFGIFYSPGDTDGLTLQGAVAEINTEYQTKIDDMKSSVSYDKLEMRGSRASWEDVLAVYAVKTSGNPENAQEVATMDEGKRDILKSVFWDMHELSKSTATKTETVVTETGDGDGNIIETKSEVTRTYLYITVTHKTADEMAAQYGFSDEQKEYLAALLSDENNSLWASVLYGITAADGQIVTVALSQVGNVGGQPYWSWYGFGSRVEWCACFVSWCANECGYIDSGVIPKFSGCTQGVQWFKERGQWTDRSAEPVPGMIIFFDWDDEEGQDGEPDHVGIVEKVDNGTVYTVEGNSGDSCRINQYSIGYYEIFGYGIPAY